MSSPRDRRILPYKAYHRSRRERSQFVLLGLATIWEGLVITLSLGFLTVSTRAWILFEVMDQDD